MKKNLHNFKNMTLGFIFDECKTFTNSNNYYFPEDATWEWESQQTIEMMIMTWTSLGFHVIPMPLNSSFFNKWSENFIKCDLIHSVVEGFGSVSRESWIPSLCELSGIPYIGSEPHVHSLCMDKAMLKNICKYLNIPTTPFYVVNSLSDLASIPKDFFSDGVFIKPVAEGSGMGIDKNISICFDLISSKETCSFILKNYPQGALIETYLSGSEFTSGFIGSPKQFLPVAQIEVEGGVYGAAYKGKEKMEEKVFFPTLRNEVEQTIHTGTMLLANHLPLHDFSRFDWKCDSKNNAYLLEINTMAGLSKTYSTLPIMASQAGVSYEMLFEKLARSALLRARNKNLYYGQIRLQEKEPM